MGRVVPSALGVILLAAAALKAQQLATGLTVESKYLTSRWILLSLIELELALGLWLVLGLYPRQTRWLALTSFATFSAASLQQALVGKASCSCFGAITLRPWYTLLFDVVAVVMLWSWRPEESIASESGGVSNSRSHSWRLGVFGLFFLPAGFLAASAGLQASGAALAIAAPRAINMGEVPASGCKEVAFTLTNSGPVPLIVARIETSCHCLKIELPNHILAPGGQIIGNARLDLREEPNFTGSLSGEVRGMDGSGAVLFALVVNVEVVPHM